MNIVFAYILVDSTSHALKIEKLLGKHNLPCKLVPVPRHLSSDCGVCVRINRLDIEKIQSVLHEQNADYRTIEEE